MKTNKLARALHDKESMARMMVPLLALLAFSASHARADSPRRAALVKSLEQRAAALRNPERGRLLRWAIPRRIKRFLVGSPGEWAATARLKARARSLLGIPSAQAQRRIATLRRVLSAVEHSASQNGASRFGGAARPAAKPAISASAAAITARFQRRLQTADERRAGRAYHRSGKRLSTAAAALELGARERAALLRIVRKIEAESAPAEWMARLAAAARSYRGKQPRVPLALRQLRDAVARSTRRSVEQRVAARALRFDRNLPLHRSLPSQLSVLPPATDRTVQTLLKRVKRADRRVGHQLASLERHLALLKSNPDPRYQQPATALAEYLAAYKRPWADAWIARQIRAFANAQRPAADKLTRNVTFRGEVSARQRREVRARLQSAWSVVQGLVHPSLLAKLPQVTVVVSADRKRANHDGTTINLSPRSSVKTILHELGHHVEDHGGFGALALAHTLRAQRADGRAPRKLKQLVPKSSYRDDEVAFSGAFITPYAGKSYSGGYTELISMALERLGSTEAAQRFYRADGHYALAVLTLLQSQPR